MAERDVIFRIGENKYGFDVQLVNAIESLTNIVPVPNSPDCILGIMNLRGAVIPVYSLRRRFGLPDLTDGTESRLIVTAYEGKTLAFIVDEVIEMTDFSDDKLSEPPVITKSEKTEYVRAVANKDGELVLLLCPASMYEGDEENRMGNLLQNMNS